MTQRDESGMRRVCSSCGVTAPGLRPAGWIIKPVMKPHLAAGRTIMVGEHAICLDCQHPELREAS